MSLSKMVAEALGYLGNVRNYAATTLESYEISFDQFRHWLYSNSLPDDVRQFTGDNVFRFADALSKKKQKASTIVIRLSALSTIARTLMKLKDGRDKPYLLPGAKPCALRSRI